MSCHLFAGGGSCLDADENVISVRHNKSRSTHMWSQKNRNFISWSFLLRQGRTAICGEAARHTAQLQRGEQRLSGLPHMLPSGLRSYFSSLVLSFFLCPFPLLFHFLLLSPTLSLCLSKRLRVSETRPPFLLSPGSGVLQRSRDGCCNSECICGAGCRETVSSPGGKGMALIWAAGWF